MGGVVFRGLRKPTRFSGGGSTTSFPLMGPFYMFRLSQRGARPALNRPLLMSMVISSIFTHGFIPRSMMDSVIVPVIKNKNKRINDKGNYRPICLSTVCSKMVEMALARRLSDSLNSSHNQFGFKLDHGTELCVFTFKELLRFYVERGSAMHIAFLDASKAFDRLNRCKLLTKLEHRGVAKYILRLISYEFISQHICIRWGNIFSDFILPLAME